MTIGTPDSARIWRQTSMPSMPGSIRSSSTRSGWSSRKAASAWSPSATMATSKPSLRSTMPSISASAGSSSTTSTRLLHTQLLQYVVTAVHRAVPHRLMHRATGRLSCAAAAPRSLRGDTARVLLRRRTAQGVSRGAGGRRPRGSRWRPRGSMTAHGRAAASASPACTAAATRRAGGSPPGWARRASCRGGCGRLRTSATTPSRAREHLVAAGLEQGPVEDRVGQQVGLQVAGAAVHDHVCITAAGHRAALVGRRPARAASAAATGSKPRRSSESESSCVGPVALVEPPADDPRVEDVPLARGLDRDADPAPRLSTRPIDSSTRIASRATLRDTA